MSESIIKFIEDSISRADNLDSKLPDGVSKKYGFSSQRVRHLLNNLCSFETAKYLNCGLFRGSSFWSAIFNNSLVATGIDTFNPPDASKEVENDFYKNLAEVVAMEKNTVVNRQINIITQDCFTVNLLDKYNVYFYDADHSKDGQYKALTYFDRFLKDKFIFIVDDFDNQTIKDSSNSAIRDMNYKVLYRWEGQGDFGNWDVNTNNVWWNGILVCLLEKPTNERI